MWPTILALALCLDLALAQWGTFYSFQDGIIYMRLKNNDMVSLNFSVTGFDNLDKYSSFTLTEINVQTNQAATSLSLPPANSLVFLHGSDLYAFLGSSLDSDLDACGDGVLQLLKYNSDLDSWSSVSDSITFSDVNDGSFYADLSYLVTDESSTIYIYGGQCLSSNKITNRLLSFDMETFTAHNVTTSTKPQPFYGASSVWAPNPQNMLVVGGKASTGWINMYQLATWNSQSGWLFQTAAQNGTNTIASRTNPLVLPIFSPLADNTTTTFANSYRPKEVLVAGGETSGSEVTSWSKLSLSSNQWTWSTVSTQLDVSQVMGAAAVFDTLVVVNATSTQKRDGKQSYHYSLYDINLLQPVSDLKSNTAVVLSAPGTSQTTKIVVGTVVPLAALMVVAAAGFFWWKRKNSDDQRSDMASVDYTFGHFRGPLDQSYDPLRHNLTVYKHPNDTSSTLEVGSIDSWVRKRQEFDAKRFRTLKRHSYLASNETLNGHLVDPSEQPEIDDDNSEHHSNDHSDNSSNDNNNNTNNNTNSPNAVSANNSPSLDLSPVAPPTPVQPRVNQLRKAFSYSQTPPQLPQLRKMSRLDPGYIDVGNLTVTDDNIDESDSCDENMDVQVLVSSKRKSVLRIMNPDNASSVSEEMRQRTPSK